jgi:hypothetical protein
MVAYSFKIQFVEFIELGFERPTAERAKGGTIREPRLGRGRHARPGEELQLYYAQRTKQCRLLGRPTCKDVQPITLDFEQGLVLIGTSTPGLTNTIAGWRRLNIFARFDGFPDWRGMRDFWDREHGGEAGVVRVFNGVHIRWLDWPKVLVP